MMQPQGHPKGHDDAKTPHHKDLMKARSFNVILIGTSMIERLQSTGKKPFEDAGLGKVGILNAGVGGDRVENILYRLEILGLLKDAQRPLPSLVILEGGVNDLDGETVEIEALAMGMGQCMDAIRAALPDTHISVLGAFPRQSDSRYGAPVLQDDVMLQRVLAFNEQLRDAIVGPRQPRCSYDGMAQDFLIASSGVRDESLFEDDVHFVSKMCLEGLPPSISPMIGPISTGQYR